MIKNYQPKMIKKFAFLFILFLSAHLTDGAAECSSQDVADSVERRLHSTLVNLTRNQAQVDELLAPVSSFLQAALLKQVLAENGINPTNTTTKNDPQLNQIREAIVRIDNTLNQILHKLNMTSTDRNGYSPSSLLHSCEEIKTQFPNSPSDYYTIIDGTGHARHVYCQMEQVCGSSSGWTRMAYLNMSDPTEECPSGFRLYSQNGVRACGRPVTSSGSCQPLYFLSYGISYSQICGRVYGYQKGNPDGLWRSNQVNDILNKNYVDGISITRGSPRKHVWSYVAGVQENFIGGISDYVCPCSTGSTQQIPSAVGNDYFCESGNPGHSSSNTFFNDRLWDGEQCGAIERGCCNAAGLPWFHKTLSSPTRDHIELRLCCDEGTGNEDVPVGLYEIYTK